MIPISRMVNSSRGLSDIGDLSSELLLIQWRTDTEGGISSWDTYNNTIILPGGVFVSWLVSLKRDEIAGFVVQGLLDCLSPSHPEVI